MKYLGLEIYDLRIRILAAKMTLFYVKILPFASSDIINCLGFFQFSIFILKESSKRCLRNQQLSHAKSYRSITF